MLVADDLRHPVSAGTQEAAATFSVLLKDAENLVALHRARSVLPGRRVEEVSLNRAVIVLAVAAWQTFVEETAGAVLDSLRPPPGSTLETTFGLLTRELDRLTERLNTPDSKKTLDLFERVGFDPRAAWTFTIRWPLQVGKVSGPLSFAPPTAVKELDAWLEVRHLIAHGKSLVGSRPAESVTTGRTKKGPTLYRADAEHCLAFFRALVKATADEAHAKFP